MAEQIEVNGASEVIANLKQLDDKVQNQVIRQGLRVGGKVLLGAAVAEAPERSGLTRRNIKMTSSSRKGSSRVSVGLAAKDYTGDAFYASFVLYGHRAGSRKLGGGRKQVPANNFLRRAAESSGGAAAEATIGAWGESIESAASSLKKG